jgi:hypothetical protein
MPSIQAKPSEKIILRKATTAPATNNGITANDALDRISGEVLFSVIYIQSLGQEYAGGTLPT